MTIWVKISGNYRVIYIDPQQLGKKPEEFGLESTDGTWKTVKEVEKGSRYINLCIVCNNKKVRNRNLARNCYMIFCW